MIPTIKSRVNKLKDLISKVKAEENMEEEQKTAPLEKPYHLDPMPQREVKMRSNLDEHMDWLKRV
jgi:hypothetical protein